MPRRVAGYARYCKVGDMASAERQLTRSKPAGKVLRDELLRRAYALGGRVGPSLLALLLNHDRTLASASKVKEVVVDTLPRIWRRGMFE